MPRYNSFDVEFHELCDDWDYINNYLLVKPSEILSSYNENVWWKCSNNQAHHYQMSPKRRVYFHKRHKESCPYCKGLRRKKEHFTIKKIRTK